MCDKKDYFKQQTWKIPLIFRSKLFQLGYKDF